MAIVTQFALKPGCAFLHLSKMGGFIGQGDIAIALPVTVNIFFGDNFFDEFNGI